MLNIVLFHRGRLVVRLVDVIVGIIGTTSTVWWAIDYGWLGALQSGLMFVLALMCAIWFF